MKAYPSSHVVAGLVPRTANAARLGRPARLNPSWSGLLERLIATLKPAGDWSLHHAPDASGTVVLCAFADEADADRLARLTGAMPAERFLGAWASCRSFLYDRHARQRLVDRARGVERGVENS